VIAVECRRSSGGELEALQYVWNEKEGVELNNLDMHYEYAITIIYWTNFAQEILLD